MKTITTVYNFDVGFVELKIFHTGNYRLSPSKEAEVFKLLAQISDVIGRKEDKNEQL